MSHLRNLFHSPPEAGRSAAVAPVIAAPENLVGSSDVAAKPTTLPEFPVEEAQFDPEQRLIFYSDPRSPAADRFRLLRMRLKEHWKTGKLKKLLITGPLAREGKSTVTMNLATALAERGKYSVLVIEADLHHSSIGESLHLKPAAGVTECLVDQTISPLSSIRRIEPFGWYLLAAGEPRRNSTELLQPPAFGHMMQQLSPCFDWILIDSPPVIPLTDSLSLQQHADGSLLVVHAGQTPREAVERTIALLGKKNIVGIVLNAVELRDSLYCKYYETTRRPTND